MKNTPYVKEYNSMGICTNPIEGYHRSGIFPNRRARRNFVLKDEKQPTNNKKGIRLLITYIGKGLFMKTLIKKQVINGKHLTHYSIVEN